MKTLKLLIAFSFIMLIAAGAFAQDASVSFRTGDLITWCPILGPDMLPLPDGSYIGIYLAGANGMPDPPDATGQPTGDDVRATNNTIGNGLDHLIINPAEPPFIPEGNLYSANGSVIIPPAGMGTEPIVNQGDVMYLRAFNSDDPTTGTHYNDLVEVAGMPGTTFTAIAPGPMVVLVCFGEAIQYGGAGPCVPQEAAGPETASIPAGGTYNFFGDECTLWITAGSTGLEVTAQLFDMQPPCTPNPGNYMTRYYELTGPTPDSFFDVFFGYSQADYDASDFGPDESMLHVAWLEGDPSNCPAAVWHMENSGPVTDTPEGGYVQATVDHFSTWSFGWDDDYQLPVELTSFTATPGDRMAKLEWVTASETNNSGFHIERSTDGENFTRIHFVDTQSEGAGETAYTWEDTHVNNGVNYTYRLVDEDINGNEFIHNDMMAEVTPSMFGDAVVITEYKLHQNYPNPFNPSTNIVYDVKDNGFVTLKVYNVMGQEVSTLVSANRENGRYVTNFDATGLSSGIYFYTVKVNSFSDTKKMLLIQ